MSASNTSPATILDPAQQMLQLITVVAEAAAAVATAVAPAVDPTAVGTAVAPAADAADAADATAVEPAVGNLTSINKLQFYQYLGSGIHGCVRLVTLGGLKHRYYAITFALDANGVVVRTFWLANCTKDDAQYILAIHSVFPYDGSDSRYKGSDCVLMEYCNYGSLKNVLYNNLSEGVLTTTCRPIPIDVRVCVIVQILKGLRLIHEGGITHGNFHGGNVLFHENGAVKVSDFGRVEIGENTSADVKAFLVALRAVDVRELGFVCAEMEFGHKFFTTAEVLGELATISHTRPDFCDFVQRCVRVSPGARPTIQQLLDHPFVSHLSTVDLDAVRRPVAAWLAAQTIPKISKLADPRVKDRRPKA